jgi:hypothetical protein
MSIMKIALKLSLLLFAAAFVLDAQITPPPGGGGSVLACVGTPGNTFGAYRSLCMDSNKAVWVCGNALTCTIAADWANVGPGGGGTVTSVSFTGGLISVANGTSTPAFTVAGTSGGVPYFNSGTTWASSGALTQYGVVLGGGAGNAPTSTSASTTTTQALFATTTAPAFRAIATGDLPTIPLAGGGTGVDLSAAGGAVNTTGAQVLHENASHVISSSAIALVDLPTITVPYGGTGLATLTAHAVQVGEGTSTLAQVGPNAATTYPLFSAGSSADPAFRAIAVGDLPVLHGQCTEAWGGSGTSFAMTSGDDAIVNNTCYNDSGATRTITAVKCRSDNAANSTAITPAFGAAGTGTTILTGAVTCGNSYAYAAGTLGTGSHIAWTTGTGIDPGMSTVGNATSIALLIEYTYQPY